VARLPEQELDRLKREISVQRLAEAHGVKLKRHGADLIGLCPFHDDKEPSLVISPQKNLWHCLGACQAGGSVIDWVIKSEGVSFRHAVEILRGDLPSAPASAAARKQSSARKLPPPVELEADDVELLRQVIDYYHETLKKSPEALTYLESRGLQSSEMIDRFRLGFANRTLGFRLPEKSRQAGAAIRGRLQKLGILRASGHEHFNGSLVIPVFHAEGRVVEVYGRKITPNLRKGTPLHLYLPGPHAGVWNVEALAVSKEIILCESLIDALSFWCAGYRHVTAAYGIRGFTAEHLEAFKAHGTERVLIAYDRDEAGETAASGLAKQLTAAGLECFRIEFPRGMDANEYALKVQPAAKSLGVLIRKALWMGKGQAPSGSAPDAATSDAATSDAATPAAEAAASVPEQASPLPAPPPPEVPMSVKPEEAVLTLGERRYRVRGLAKNLAYDVMKVNLLASRGDAYHVDTLELYSARQRASFVHQASVELGMKEEVIKKDLGKVLLKLEELQDEQIRAALEPKDEAVILADAEKASALELLRDPQLLDRILEDFERCGVVGEETNKLVGYLAAVSRQAEQPLAVIIQSSTAAGKTSLMEAILAFMPEEERVQYSAMTGQSLFYMGETNLSHKILAIVEEEGAERASYALKLLQSEGELTIASTGKDPSTGRLVTHEYRVQGPVMIFLTTTAIDLDEELLNRCLVLSVDEGREQTRAIHRLQRQRRTLAGLKARASRGSICKRHQDAQRLLRPLLVMNPYAADLTFLDTRTRTRRDHEKYLTLIDAIALLHQYQRDVRSFEVAGRRRVYVEVTLGDIEVANRLAHQVLGRSLDELPPQTRRLLLEIDALVSAACERLSMDRSDYRFSRRDVRESTGLGNTQLKLHLHRLEELEYLLVHRGGRGQSFVYELLYERREDADDIFLIGLIDAEKLRRQGEDVKHDEKKSGFESSKSVSKGEKSGPGRLQVGGVSGGGRVSENPLNSEVFEQLPGKSAKSAHLGHHQDAPSCPQARRSPVPAASASGGG